MQYKELYTYVHIRTFISRNLNNNRKYKLKQYNYKTKGGYHFNRLLWTRRPLFFSMTLFTLFKNKLQISCFANFYKAKSRAQ